MAHLCHALGCSTPTKPARFVCVRHWHRLPRWLRYALKATYVPGQERTKAPCRRYVIVMQRCRLALARVDQWPHTSIALATLRTLVAKEFNITEPDDARFYRLVDAALHRTLGLPPKPQRHRCECRNWAREATRGPPREHHSNCPRSREPAAWATDAVFANAPAGSALAEARDQFHNAYCLSRLAFGDRKCVCEGLVRRTDGEAPCKSP